MSGLLVRKCELDGARTADVRVRGPQVVEIGEELEAADDESVLHAAGGALLPGLHDHHLHLLSLAVVAESVHCGPPEVTDAAGLERALHAAPAGWVRGIGYHESVSGILDRDVLDSIVVDRPVRIQHRGGALWMLNSAAINELRLGNEAAVECDEAGRPTGRLWRGDDLLRERLPRSHKLDLAVVGHQLAKLGITGFTEATPNLAADTVELLADAVTSGALPQRVQLLGAQPDVQLPSRMSLGPHKILRPDHRPPDWDELSAEVARARAAGREVAIHTVTRESLVVTLAVLAELGAKPGDRIEHAAVVGQDSLPMLASTVQTVVTQPSFIAERGDQYRQDIPAAEHDDLYRYATLLRAGIRVAPSSDAPFASEDPWRAITAAVHRRTTAGNVLGPAELVTPQQMLGGLLSPLHAPGGKPRRIEVGASADLCLLGAGLAEALRAPRAELVRATICAGSLVFQAG